MTIQGVIFVAVNVEKLNSMSPPKGMPFRIGKHGVKSLEEAIAHPVPGRDTSPPSR